MISRSTWIPIGIAVAMFAAGIEVVMFAAAHLPVHAQTSSGEELIEFIVP